MKRQDLLALIRVAGYHNDTRAGVRLFTENRINREAYDAAWHDGQKMREKGMRCACPQCKAANNPQPAP
jgi:hypothetical protein